MPTSYIEKTYLLITIIINWLIFSYIICIGITIFLKSEQDNCEIRFFLFYEIFKPISEKIYNLNY